MYCGNGVSPLLWETMAKEFLIKFGISIDRVENLCYTISCCWTEAADAGVAQPVEQLICNQQVGGSNPSTSSTISYGGVPEWPKGADCKSVAFRFGGSNPPSSTRKTVTPIGVAVFPIGGEMRRRLLAVCRGHAATAGLFRRKANPPSSTTSSRTAYRSRRRFLFQSKRHLSLIPSLLLIQTEPAALGFGLGACDEFF